MYSEAVRSHQNSFQVSALAEIKPFSKGRQNPYIKREEKKKKKKITQFFAKV